MNAVIVEDLQNISRANLPWQRFSGKTVLVTGAGGIVGSYLVWALLELNRSILTKPVTVLASGRDLKQMSSKLGENEHLCLVELDLASTQPIELEAHFIIHAASMSRTSQHRFDPLGTIAPNVFGTQALLEMAHRCSSEAFLFVSSGAVYGQPEMAKGVRVTEDVAGSYPHLNIAMSYAEAKRMGEFLCLAWNQSRGVPTTMARLGHTYGPGLETSDERIFADFVFRILRGENLVLNSSGTAVRPFCYLSDAITGLLTILLMGKTGEAYNLVNSRAESSVLDLAHQLCELFPEKNLKVEVRGEASHSFQNQIHISTAKLEALGWSPQVSLQDGFRRTVLSYS